MLSRRYTPEILLEICSRPMWCMTMSEDYLLEIHSGHIFRDILQTNVMYIHVWRCFSRDTLWRYFWRYAPDQCDVYPCLEMLFQRYTPEIFLAICSRSMWCISMSGDVILEIHSGDIFGDMLWTNVMYIHVQRLVSGDKLQRYFQRYAPDQCEVYPCPEMVFQRYTLEIFLEICSGPMWCISMSRDFFRRYTLEIFLEICSGLIWCISMSGDFIWRYTSEICSGPMWCVSMSGDCFWRYTLEMSLEICSGPSSMWCVLYIHMSEDCCPGDALQINMIGMHRSILGSLSPSEYPQVQRYLLQRYTLEEYTFECLRGSQSAHNAPHVWRLLCQRCTSKSYDRNA